jgi:hypothetical protein
VPFASKRHDQQAENSRDATNEADPTFDGETMPADELNVAAPGANYRWPFCVEMGGPVGTTVSVDGSLWITNHRNNMVLCLSKRLLRRGQPFPSRAFSSQKSTFVVVVHVIGPIDLLTVQPSW